MVAKMQALKRSRDPFLSGGSESSGKRMKPTTFAACSHHRDWSGLPWGILSSIAVRLDDMEDYIRFGSVCAGWRGFFLEENSSSRFSSSERLFLLVGRPPPEELDHRHRALYSVTNDKVLDFRLRVPHHKDCRGSSFGWLVTVETKEPKRPDCRVQLLNPFISRIIDLPPLDSIARQYPGDWDDNWDAHYFEKAVLSSDPCSSPDDFVVMAIMSRYRGLAFFRPGDPTWTSVGDWCRDYRLDMEVVDIIFSHRTNLFYALRNNGSITAIDLLGDEAGNPKITQIATRPQSPYSFPRYLVEGSSSGDLFLVCGTRHTDGDIDTFFDETEERGTMIVEFNVFKLNASSGIWTEVDNLGDNIMFLGSNGSILRSAADCPGCKPNCIYYTDDGDIMYRYNSDSYGPPSDGIYDLKDATVGSHYSSPRPAYTKPLPSVNAWPQRPSPTEVLPQPIWIEPTLKGRSG